MSKRKKYTEEFRREAAMQVIQNGHRVVDVAQRLGLTESALYNWVAKYKKPAPVLAAESDSANEIRRLRKELKRVSEERDILKKAATYFAKQSE